MEIEGGGGVDSCEFSEVSQQRQAIPAHFVTALTLILRALHKSFNNAMFYSILSTKFSQPSSQTQKAKIARQKHIGVNLFCIWWWTIFKIGATRSFWIAQLLKCPIQTKLFKIGRLVYYTNSYSSQPISVQGVTYIAPHPPIHFNHLTHPVEK